MATCHPDRPIHAKGLCQSCYLAAWMRTQPDGYRDRKRAWRRANPQKLAMYKRRQKYGMSQQEYETLLLVQCGKCAICTEVPDQLYVDHDHATGAVRGLLCQKCNQGIGLLQDSIGVLTAASDYLSAARGI